MEPLGTHSHGDKKARSDQAERPQSLHLSASSVDLSMSQTDSPIVSLERLGLGVASARSLLHTTIRESTMLAKGMRLGVELVVTTTRGSRIESRM